MPSPSRKNPWSSPEWKALVERLRKDYCEICGSRTPPFTLHHEKPLLPYSSIRTQVAESLFSELLDKGELNTDLIQVTIRDSCPECDSINVQGPRSTISPPFYCGRCYHRFDHPVKKKVKNDKALRRDFFQRFKDEIDKRTQIERDKQSAYYLSGKDVITVCSRCHLPTEQGKVLCKICNHHFHNARFNQCWECFIKMKIADGQVKCKFCESKFHSSDEPACDECSILRSTIYCQECNQTKYSLSCYCYNCETSICEDCSSKHSERGHDVV